MQKQKQKQKHALRMARVNTKSTAPTYHGNPSKATMKRQSYNAKLHFEGETCKSMC